MTGGGMQKIVPGIWCRQRRPRRVRPGEFGRTSYAFAAGGETLLIDWR